MRTLSLRRWPFPAGAGAHGPGFQVVDCDGVPVLIENNIGYPGSFDGDARVRTALQEPWDLLFDPEETGEQRLLQNGEDAQWNGEPRQTVTVPHCFNSAESRHKDYCGVVWYRIRFPTPAAAAGTWLRLCFEGVLLSSVVWFNGVRLGLRNGGYTPFYFDITSELGEPAVANPAGGAGRGNESDGRRNENVLVVRVDSRLTWSSLPPRTQAHHAPGWHPYGGIYRPVSLTAVPHLSVLTIHTHAAIGADETGVVDCSIVIERHPGGVDRPYRISAELHDPNDVTCATSEAGGPAPSRRVAAAAPAGAAAHAPALAVARLALKVRHPQRYEAGSARLYRLHVSLTDASGSGLIDGVSILIGFRTVEVTADGISINGRRSFLRGIARHEDHPQYGPVQPLSLTATDLAWVERLGANYVRLAHYPHSISELRMLRDRAIWASEEIPLYQAGLGFAGWVQEQRRLRKFPWSTFGLRQLRLPELLLNAQRELLEMIERDRNNPAVLFWSVGNECYSLFPAAGRVFAWLRDVAKCADPTRPVTAAEPAYSVRLLDRYRCGMRHMDIISVNLYYGWYYGSARDAGPHLDRIRRRHPDKPIIISEFGADAAPGRRDADGIWRAERMRRAKTYSEEYQAQLIEQYWYMARERPWVCGVSPWVFADFLCSWFPGNPVPGYNLKGLLSSGRVPKRGFFALARLYHAAAAPPHPCSE